MHVVQSGTNSSHALKLIRPRTAPSIRIGVIAAKTNWKYTSVDVGKWNGGPVVTSGMPACPCSATWSSTAPGWPMKLPKKPVLAKPCHGWPKPMSNAQQTQAIKTSPNAANASIMLFTDQRFCITPP